MMRREPLVVLLGSCLKRLAGSLFLLLLGLLVSAYGQQQANELVSVNNDTVIAQVASYEITIRDYQKTLRQLIAIYTRGGDSLPAARIRARGIDQRALDSLINDRLASVEGERLGIVVTDREVQAEIERMFTDPQSGQFVGQKTLEQMLAQRGETIDGYKFETRLLMAKGKLRNRVVANVKISNAEVEKEFTKKRNQFPPSVRALEKEHLRERLLNDRQMQVFDEYLKVLRKRYDAEGKIKIYQDRIELFFRNGGKV
ncbi:MAG TPA: SurA N-terminal domain-containing protein [Blastocatellia bacterium]|nr:SurA N-terminal domain-containing protein [Blastocatellia bacterium]